MKKTLILLLVCLSSLSHAQKIIYSTPGNENIDDVDSHIIGMINNHLLIYKSSAKSSGIMVFDKNMTLVKYAELGLLKQANIAALSFIKSADHCYLIFQTVHKNTIYCKITAIDENGQPIGPINTIDSTESDVLTNNMLYDIEQSDNKNYTLLGRTFPGIGKDKLLINHIVIDTSATVYRNDHYFIPCSKTEWVSNAKIDNEGNIVFYKFNNDNTSFKSKLTFYKTVKGSMDLETKDFEMNTDEFQSPILEIDNLNHLYHIVSLYNSYSTGKQEGLALFTVHSDVSKDIQPILHPFNKLTELSSAIENHPQRSNYSINNYFMKEDGSFSVSLVLNDIETKFRTVSNAISSYRGPTTIRNVRYPFRANSNAAFDRLLVPDPVAQSSRLLSTKVITHDLIIYSFDKDSHFVHFSRAHSKISLEFIPVYLTMNLTNEVVFVYNEPEKNTKVLLKNFSLQKDGTVLNNALFRDLDKGYVFYPEWGKQVDATTLIVPCRYKQKPAFAKIMFE